MTSFLNAIKRDLFSHSSGFAFIRIYGMPYKACYHMIVTLTTHKHGIEIPKGHGALQHCNVRDGGNIISRQQVIH